jgi:CheY-like chemotaxis protein
MGLVLDRPLEAEKTLSLKILVVDDDALGRRLMHLILTKEGHRVKQNKFDIVFMDLNMPDMGGMEASRKIRDWESGDSHTFIVALTASYLPEIGQSLFDSGMDNYISKPLDVAQVQRLLKYSSPASH